MGREATSYLQPALAGDEGFETKGGDAVDLRQCHRLFGLLRMAKPILEARQDRLLGVTPNADDEGKGEFGAVSIVEAVEGGELPLAQLVDAGARVLPA